MNTLFIILTLLRLDGAQENHLQQARPYLTSVAAAIDAAAVRSVPRERLIAIAFEESRFGYRQHLRGSFPIGAAGECGVFQQLPRFAPLGGDCNKLGRDLGFAARSAVASVRYVIRRWRVRGGASMDRKICHYNGGNRCNSSARAYARRHARTRARVLRIMRGQER